jgi:hypothetical protein
MVTSEQFDATVAELSKAMNEGLDLEAAIVVMKREQFSPIDCIKGAMQLTGCSLADATRTVHFSTAWAEELGSDR